MKRVIVCILVCMLLLCGCSAYPELEGPSRDYELAEATNELITIKYPAEGWEAPVELMDDTMLTVIDSETAGDINFNVQVTMPFDGRITKELLTELMTYYDDSELDGMTLTMSEMRIFNGSNIVYFEQDIEFTDDMIDYMLEEGTLSEKEIEARGGRDAFKSLEKRSQVGIYYIAKGYLCVSVGTYNDEASKEAVLDAMKIAIETTQIG